MRGIPNRVISDRGTCFTGRAFKNFCHLRGISHTLNSTRHPQANGQVERVNRTIIPLLSIMSKDQEHWDDRISELERHLNSAVNKTSTRSPFEILHGYRPRYHGGALASLSRTRDDWTDPSVLQGQAHNTIAAGQMRMKQYYDQRHHDGTTFDIGEVVVMLRQPRAHQSAKLQAKYRERPLQIMEILPGDTYRVAEVVGDGREVYATTAHVSQLKSWKILREADEEENNDQPDSDGDVRHEVEVKDPIAVEQSAVDEINDQPSYDGDVRHEVDNCVHQTRPRRTKRVPARLLD